LLQRLAELLRRGIEPAPQILDRIALLEDQRILRRIA
jgi:hypothetical protein